MPETPRPVPVPDPLDPLELVDTLDVELAEIGRGLELAQVGLLAVIALGVGVLVARTRRS